MLYRKLVVESAGTGFQPSSIRLFGFHTIHARVAYNVIGHTVPSLPPPPSLPSSLPSHPPSTSLPPSPSFLPLPPPSLPPFPSFPFHLPPSLPFLPSPSTSLPPSPSFLPLPSSLPPSHPPSHPPSFPTSPPSLPPPPLPPSLPPSLPSPSPLPPSLLNYLLQLSVPWEVTAHVHSGPVSLQHSSREQQTDQRPIFAGVNDELVSHLVLRTTLLRVVQQTAQQDVQHVQTVQVLLAGLHL